MRTQRKPGAGSRILVVVALMLTAIVVVAQTMPPTAKRFIACPIYRDTDAGRKSGCWLATEVESGARYDVTEAPFKPLLGRQVLVEGVVSGDKDICGGVVLRPVRTSVLEDSCPAVLVPAEGYPSKPSALPSEIVLPLSVPRALPKPPFERAEFNLIFDYGDDRLVYQSADVVLERASLFALASKARSIEIVGYADGAGVIASGRLLRESSSLAKARAEMAAEALRRLGVPSNSIQLRWGDNPQPVPDAGVLPEPSKRRVTIVVTP